MHKKLIERLRGCLSTLLYFFNTLFWFVPILLLGLIKLLLPLKGWRAMFDLVPDGAGEPINLRLFLQLDGQALTETWIYQYTPPPLTVPPCGGAALTVTVCGCGPFAVKSATSTRSAVAAN